MAPTMWQLLPIFSNKESARGREADEEARNNKKNKEKTVPQKKDDVLMAKNTYNRFEILRQLRNLTTICSAMCVWVSVCRVCVDVCVSEV